MQQIMADELNVKEVINEEGTDARILVNTDLTDELKAEGIARDLIRLVNNARKNANFNVEDRIHLKITSDNKEITEAVKQFKDLIFAETLTNSDLTGVGTHSETTKLDGQELTISVTKQK
jgi:isoleucyl-tRNA synthetase